MKIEFKTSYLYIIAGICLALAYPPINFYLLIFPGYVLLLNIVSKCENYKQLFRRTYIVAFVFELIAISWIPLSGVRENADRFLILGGIISILFHSLYNFIPLVVYFFVLRNIKFVKFPHLNLFFFPFIWTGFEYLLSQNEFSFPWLIAGNSFTTNLSKIQYIDYTGVYGISFWICVLSVLVYYLYINLKSNDTNIFSALRYKKNIVTIIIIVIIYILPNIYSIISSSEKNYTKNYGEEKITLGIIQPNINPWKKWGGQQMDLINVYASMIIEGGKLNPKTKLLVLPETAIPFYFLDRIYEEKYKVIKGACDSAGIPVLTGTPDYIVYDNNSKIRQDSKQFKSNGLYYDTFNSAILIEKNKDKTQFQKYAKIKLVAASERMPYQEKLPFLKSLISWGVGLSSYQTGKDTTIFLLDNKYKFNVAICYESIFPEFFSEFINKGAEFSLIITNDGWWGKLFGTHQHNQYAVLRAIENRRWIARCANTGISCVIDPYGNIYRETGINDSAIFTEDVGIRKEKTFYTLRGDMFSRICLYISFLLLVSGIGLSIKKRFMPIKIY